MTNTQKLSIAAIFALAMEIGLFLLQPSRVEVAEPTAKSAEVWQPDVQGNLTLLAAGAELFGTLYAFEISSNLVAWSIAGYVTNSASGTCHFTNAVVPNFGPLLYRAKRMQGKAIPSNSP